MTQLKEGDKAPWFEGVNEKGEKVSLNDFQGKKLILFFYPKDNTPGCTQEVCNLRDNYSALKAEGFSLLGVSPDSEKKHTGFITKHELPFSLLADTERKTIEAFGVWGPKKFMGRTFDGVHRTTFIINESGVIDRVFRKVKTKEHASQILEAL